MKLRTALAAVAGTIGGTALANRVLQADEDEFEPFIDAEYGTYRWRGFDVHYAELGDPEDQDVLLFHGINAAAANHEFEQVARELADTHHVIVPDLPGFGHSDRPPLLYSNTLYETFAEDAITELSEGSPLVVGSGLTGAYVAQAARETPVESLVLVCPTDSTMGGGQVWLRGLVRSPVIGQGLYNLVTSKPSIRYFNTDHGYYDSANMTDDIVDYEWQTAHQPGARFAPASFVSGFLDPDEELSEVLTAVEAPVTLVWGRNADISPLSQGRELAEAADTGLVVFDQAKLLPHVEHPAQFVETLAEEAAATH